MRGIPAHVVEGLATTVLADVDPTTTPSHGDTLVWDEPSGKYIPGTPPPPPRLVPLTTTVGGVPQFVWDENDNLVMTEVPA